MSSPSPGSKSPAVFGHRGGDGGPENSLAAIRAAAAAGADGVEIDVHLDADGHAVIGHDPPAVVGRAAAGGGGPLLLTSMLAEIEQAGLRLLIDFKSGGDPAGEAGELASILADVQRRDLLMVSSFSIPFLEALAPLATDLPLFPLISLRQNVFGPPDSVQWAGVSVLAGALINPVLLFRLRQVGGQRLVWFAATEWWPLVEAAARAGADVLIVKKLGQTLTRLSERSDE